MRRDYHNWYSPRLDRHMELLVFGQGGTPIVVFPTSHGRFYEYENAGMVQAVSGKIDAGQVQLFCVDSVNSESWYNRSIHPHDRVRRQVSYEDYVLNEVFPLIRGINGASRAAVTGCSFGAYHALNLAMRHPELASACITMSGAFDLTAFMDGYYDDDFYFNNPVDYLRNMSDPWFLERYQKMRLVLAVGDHDICLGENFKMAEILGTSHIPHYLDVWTGGERHDWPLWQRMAQKFF
jgi:esterase/lipase superfamily enzyme